MMAGAYDAAEAYVPLALTAVHGLTPSLAGLPLTIGALGWSAASAWQGRYAHLSRSKLLQVAMVLVGVGIAGVSLVALRQVPSWVVFPAWVFAGTGMGIGMPAVAVLVLGQSPDDEQGFNSSAVQLAEVMGSVILVGLGGVLINMLGSTSHPGGPLLLFDLVLAGVAVLGALIPGGRTQPVSR
jgi:MFS family permease